jgi:UDP-N-acetylmuramate dehydrogenase
MVKKNTHNELKKVLGKDRVKKNVVLAPYTTFKMGGRAEYFFEAYNKNELIKTYRIAKKLGLPLLVLGGGSNVVISEKKIKGLVVRNLYGQKRIIKKNTKNVTWQISSGYSMTRLVKDTIDQGLCGFEYFLGLPGTLGGALYMNSKWTKPLSCVGDNLISAEIIDKNGKIKNVDKTYFQFAYDFSILQKTKELLLTATFLLKKEDKNILRKRANESLLYRKKTQPFGVYSAGCFFKNVGGKSAGHLIDKCNLKGCSFGDFYVSQKHANFIINRGKGKSEDLMKLVKLIKEEVKKKLGVRLEEEVIII